MIWNYAYTPAFWPMLASALFSSLLGMYVWLRRRLPGAQPFAIMLIFMPLWSIGAAMELAAEDIATKAFWFKFRAVMKLPVATAELCFGLQYAGLGHLLTRRNVFLLSIPPLLVFMLVITNDIHHLLWLGFRWEGVLYPLRSTQTYMIVGYANLLAVALFVILVRLVILSPQHLWPVILILTEVAIARTASLLDYAGVNPFSPMDLVVRSAAGEWLAKFRCQKTTLFLVPQICIME